MNDRAANLYHFTDTARLPWIIVTGELRPGPNRIGGFPDPDFLWATTNNRGDCTASCRGAASRGAWRSGRTRLVRFTLQQADFEPWSTIRGRYSQWTAEHVFKLEEVARRRGQVDFASWYCRADGLPLSRALSVETRTYAGSWQSLKGCAHVVFDGRPDMRGILIEGLIYSSTRVPAETNAYAVGQPISIEKLRGRSA